MGLLRCKVRERKGSKVALLINQLLSGLRIITLAFRYSEELPIHHKQEKHADSGHRPVLVEEGLEAELLGAPFELLALGDEVAAHVAHVIELGGGM